MYSWILLEFEAYLVLNRPQHFERSAGRIVGVKSIAVQADLAYLSHEASLLFRAKFLYQLPPVRELIIFCFINSIVGIIINIV